LVPTSGPGSLEWAFGTLIFSIIFRKVIGPERKGLKQFELDLEGTKIKDETVTVNFVV